MNISPFLLPLAPPFLQSEALGETKLYRGALDRPRCSLGHLAEISIGAILLDPRPTACLGPTATNLLPNNFPHLFSRVYRLSSLSLQLLQARLVFIPIVY